MSATEKEFLQEGMTCLKNGDLERAEEIFKDFLRQFPGSDLADNACYQIAQINQKTGQKMKALSWLDYLLKNYPDSDAAYFAKDEREELQRELDAMVPGSPEEAFSKAKAAFEQGTHEVAEQLFREFLAHHGTHPLAGDAHYHLAVIYARQGRADAARRHGEILRRDFPGSDAAFMVGYLLGQKA
ncbi:MAG: hypothetical protein OZSIB_3860 [Candidatus Ozemobacter sibiricus]|jgi:TolA-binding protein|uniref:Outer membrane lipoprotein BamD-like domain-containing protein n=1 Tax=Candidatus Ozemobacter sibiricus TaxID=2268124 RepID=A0A367ZRM8_9BACT|nr:MAG: hypothetical protein OZSIB_3860 [Candidatus Ozemobacter sibiricus]